MGNANRSAEAARTNHNRVKAIMIHPKTGALMGGVSPTGDSYVMAW